ncbi:hypothetical protein [Deefgea rivuli]|uniref:hypothetical protein n=1 Tax=Deefgea rivuli TaxID=400948 RepID=UPI0012EB55A6|nr:hypothetical protein [Deefgea rivuli]
MEPHWTAYVSALSVPVIGLFAASIAYRQWRTAQNKLKYDLFDKRFKVYRQCCAFVSSVVSNGEVLEEVRINFMRETLEARWLFDKDLDRYLIDEIHGKAVELQVLEAMFDADLARDERNENLAQQSNIKRWFNNQFTVLESRFEKYLNLKH